MRRQSKLLRHWHPAYHDMWIYSDIEVLFWRRMWISGKFVHILKQRSHESRQSRNSAQIFLFYPAFCFTFVRTRFWASAVNAKRKEVYLIMYHSEFISFHANVISDYNHILRCMFYVLTLFVHTETNHANSRASNPRVYIINIYSGSAAHVTPQCPWYFDEKGYLPSFVRFELR